MPRKLTDPVGDGTYSSPVFLTGAKSLSVQHKQIQC